MLRGKQRHEALDGATGRAAGQASCRSSRRLGSGCSWSATCPAPCPSLRELVEPRDCALALDPGGVAGRQALDQGCDPVPDLQGEMRCRRPDQLAHVVHRHTVLRRQSVGSLCSAHDRQRVSAPHRSSSRMRTISLSSSMRACNSTLIGRFVAHHPDVVVHAADGVEPVARLDVLQEALQRAGQDLGVLDEQQRTVLPARGEDRTRRSVERALRVCHHHAVARVAQSPAEGRVRVPRECDGILDRPPCGRFAARGRVPATGAPPAPTPRWAGRARRCRDARGCGSPAGSPRGARPAP